MCGRFWAEPLPAPSREFCERIRTCSKGEWRQLPTSLPCIPGAGPNRGARPRRHQRPPDAGARLPFVAANRKLSPPVV